MTTTPKHTDTCASQGFTGGQGLEFIPCDCGAASQTEAETLIARLLPFMRHLQGCDFYHIKSCNCDATLILKDVVDRLTIALRERDEAIQLKASCNEERVDAWHVVDLWKARALAAERERDEAKRVIANLRESLDMAHEQMRELDDLQAGQQDQITTLRALMQRLAEMDPAGEDGSWRCFFCSELLASQTEYGGEIIEHPHDPNCPWLKATRLASDLESRS